MTDKYDEASPGVTLNFKRSAVTGKSEDGASHVELVLDCRVKDAVLWEEVAQKFKDGMRVFTAPDFHIEVMDVMRLEIRELQDKLQLSERALKQEKDIKEGVLKKLAVYEGSLGVFGRALRGRHTGG